MPFLLKRHSHNHGIVARKEIESKGNINILAVLGSDFTKGRIFGIEGEVKLAAIIYKGMGVMGVGL